MLLISTYVAPSAIEGLGVFADEYVPRGSLMPEMAAVALEQRLSAIAP